MVPASTNELSGHGAGGAHALRGVEHLREGEHRVVVPRRGADFREQAEDAGLAMVEVAHVHGRVLQFDERRDEERPARRARHLVDASLARLGRGLARKHIPGVAGQISSTR